MISTYRQNYENILTILQNAEEEQKKRYDSAINIEDIAEFTATTKNAKEKITKIRRLVEQLNHFNSEITSLFGEESKPTAEIKPITQTKLITETKPTAETKPITQTKPAEETNPTAQTKPTEKAEQPKPLEPATHAVISTLLNEPKEPNEAALQEQEEDTEPEIITFFDKTYSSSDCGNLLKSLCEELISRTSYKFNNLCFNAAKMIDFQTYFYRDKPSSGNYVALSNGFYVGSVSTPKEAVSLCQNLLRYCGF